jgi:outer membrane protein
MRCSVSPGRLQRDDPGLKSLTKPIIPKEVRTAGVLAVVVVVFLFLHPQPALALTIAEALSLARETFPVMKASQFTVQSSDALYKASLSPYLPTLDAATTQGKHHASIRDYDLSNYDVTALYTLFDGGKRKADREIAKSNLDISGDELARTDLDLTFDVKSAFYGTIARRDILDERGVQLRNAEKDYEIAQGRHRLGVAKLSDVLQASVRLEQARYNLVLAEGGISKGLAELNSLVGRPLDTPFDLNGSLIFEVRLPARSTLEKFAMERPEINQGESSIKIAKSNVKLQTSPFYPVLTANGSYSKVDGSLIRDENDEDSSIGLVATWNLFELNKFYRRKSAELKVRVSEENLNETVRQILLSLTTAYDDFLTASRNVVVAEQQLRTSEQNYAQALGEYRVGKGDILSLVVAESALARAREQLILSRLDFVLSKARLERTAGIDKLELLSPQ